jgi:hypothetical protein
MLFYGLKAVIRFTRLHRYSMRINSLKNITARMFNLGQRKYKRFKVDDRVFVVFGPHLHKRKPIIDISMGGLSYVDGEDQLTKSLRLNLVADNSLYFDDKVLFMPILQSEPVYSFEDSIKTNRQAVQFIGLTTSQKSRLKNFIQSHAIDSV